ncbi:unannotated protein [freshwater metagenome]|uniref:Unannotated protein n=1 Tax=freshwater metagenome TaxID=449393 RepID=A0A6J7J4I6_9ZZZZ
MRAWARVVTCLSGFHQNVSCTDPLTACRSNTHTCPYRSRPRRVAAYRSGLLLVTIVAPGAAKAARTARATVFPIRVPARATITISHDRYTGLSPTTVVPRRNPHDRGSDLWNWGIRRCDSLGDTPRSLFGATIVRAARSTSVRPLPRRTAIGSATATIDTTNATAMAVDCHGQGRCPVKDSNTPWIGLPLGSPPARNVPAHHDNTRVITTATPMQSSTACRRFSCALVPVPDLRVWAIRAPSPRSRPGWW